MTTCPSSNSSYEAAAAKKNCLSIAADNQQCESFEYHCVLSNDMTHAVEVCAPYLKIIGMNIYCLFVDHAMFLNCFGLTMYIKTGGGIF